MSQLLPCTECGKPAGEIEYSDSLYGGDTHKIAMIGCSDDTCPVEVTVGLNTSVKYPTGHINNVLKTAWNLMNNRSKGG